jgi:hypothetical protein
MVDRGVDPPVLLRLTPDHCRTSLERMQGASLVREGRGVGNWRLTELGGESADRR